MGGVGFLKGEALAVGSINALATKHALIRGAL
jgi:hypothetical protein